MENSNDQGSLTGTAAADANQNNAQGKAADAGADNAGQKPAVTVMTVDQAWETINGKIAELGDDERALAQAAALIARNFLADLHAIASR